MVSHKHKKQNKNMIHLSSTLSASVTNFAAADLEKTISDLSISVVSGGSVALIVLVILAILFSQKRPSIKPVLFGLILLIVVGTTLTISGATVYLNVKSATGGPVHWHADVEYWACGNELELRDPRGALSNKIGTPTLHEHNDKRIHLEGVPVTLPEDASLGKFMQVVGGEVSKNSLIVPLNDEKYFEDTPDELDGDGAAAPDPAAVQPYILQGTDGKYAKFVSGQTCNDEAAEVQVFAYRYDDKTKSYTQTKIEHPEHYEISHHSEVPPGDCVIFEFAPKKDRTDKLCQQYGIRDRDRCQQFGVKPDEDKICEIREVR